MKLIITGATGYVGKEVVRQSLGRPEITSVVAVARKPVPVPDNLPAGADASKLRSVVVADYTEYPDDVRKEFAGADACIWCVSLPSSLLHHHHHHHHLLLLLNPFLSFSPLDFSVPCPCFCLLVADESAGW